MGGRGAVAPAIAIWAGLSVGSGLPLAAVGWGIAAGCLLVLLAWRAGSRVGAGALAAACFASGIARGSAHTQLLAQREAAVAAISSPVWVRGVVADHPALESGEPGALLRLTEVDRAPLLQGARIRVWLPEGSIVEWGDRIEALVRLDGLRPRRVPGGFDARAAARAQGISAQGRALAVRRVSSGATLARGTLVRWRRGIEDGFRHGLSPQAREIVTPLVIGDRTGVGAELAAGFQAAGLTHLLALSGLHVVWMAAVARGLVALLGGGVASRAWAGALCAALYLGIAGPLPSLARAAVHEAVTAWARLRDRAVDPLQTLAAVAAIVLAVAPGWAGDLGFQLSCAATAGLVAIAPRPTARPASGLLRGWLAIRRATMPTVAAQVAALPLLLARFHALPWTTLAANLVAVPICELLLAAAWLGAMFEALLPDAARVGYAACEALCVGLREVVTRSAAAPAALWPTGHNAMLPWLAGLGAALLALSCGAPRDLESRAFISFRRWWARCLGALAIGLVLLLAAATRPLRPPSGQWWIVVLDVGQGDAIALGFADGWWLVDAGPASERFDAGRASLLPFFRWAGERSLDTVILTHAHADHVGGAAAVLATMPARRLVLRAGMRPPPSRCCASIRWAVAGDTLRSENPAVVVRWPPAGRLGRDENANSMVLEVGGESARTLLAADVDSTIESSLAVRHVVLLKVAHHGAGRSSGATALEGLAPRWAAVSCGRSNPFGHPDAGALERLRRSGAQVHRTDREGTLWFEIGPRGARWLEAGEPEATRGTNALAPAPAAARILAAAPARW